MKKLSQKHLFLFAAGVALLLAVLGFVRSSRTEETAQTVLLIICSVLLIVLALMYVTLTLIPSDEEDNFFLYDAEFGRNRSKRELNAELVERRIDLFIKRQCKGYDRLITQKGFVIDLDPEFEVFRPLVVYKTLLDAAVNDSVFKLYESADEETVIEMCRALQTASEDNIPKVLAARRDGRVDSLTFRRYLSENSKYIKSRMLGYVKENLEKFY